MEKREIASPSNQEARLPPAPAITPRMAPPQRSESPRLAPMSRPSQGRVGRLVRLLCNHFRVGFQNLHDSFHYNVTISGERDGKQRDVFNKAMCRKIMDKVKEVYGDTELDGKNFAYDGEKSMFTTGPLSHNNIECMVLIEEERVSQRQTFCTTPS